MSTTASDRRGQPYRPAVGPRLKPWLRAVLISFALLGASGAYLSSVTFLQWARGTLQQTYFSMLMVFAHLAVGLLAIVPFLVFGTTHLVTSWKRPSKRAIQYGLALFAVGLLVIVSGLVLLRLEIPLGPRLGAVELEVRDPRIRAVGYWLHVALPVLAVLLYLGHRLAGPRVRWESARYWIGGTAAAIAVLGVLHGYDPRSQGRSSDPRYTFPSMARLSQGKLISQQSLMMDKYCMECHQDAYDGWFHSAHHFSSFNNPAYLFSVRETRKVALERDGNTRASRWCAGCHDPVPFFSGAFDDPAYDDVNTDSSQAGITCTACHSITAVHSTRGNADYTIEEPQHYPFAYSANPFLQWVNQTLVKAKPELHKRTFLKPEVHRDSAFCSTCHKVSLPYALNHYQEFTRGQNHWDSFLLSGVSGGGARSFYYPEVAKSECNDCHMPLADSRDFGAQDFDRDGGREIHDHLFPGANTGLAAMRNQPDVIEAHRAFLQKNLRIDLFGIRAGNRVDGALTAPLRPETPVLEPGSSYLIEAVVRTLAVGHLFTQGTTDSNEVWVELEVKDGDRLIGRSGGIGPDGRVDPYAHFINVYMLDRDGNRIDRRNAADIFTPLYNKQIPPGAGQVVHFGLDLPLSAQGPLTITARVHYRKFDRVYMDYVFGPGQGPEMPVVLMASDTVQLPVADGPPVENPPSPIADAWQRWNDYGIGLFLEGGVRGGQKGELRQAEAAFQQVAELGRADGFVNLARVYLREGRVPEAREALARAAEQPNLTAPWVIDWLSGLVNEANGYLDEAIASYRAVLATRVPDRKFDFSRDYEVNNSLALALFNRGRLEQLGSPERRRYLLEAVSTWRTSLALDAENVAAHYGLGLAYAELARAVTAPASPAAKLPGTDQPSPEAIESLTVALVDAAEPARQLALAPALNQRIEQFLNEPRHEFVNRIEPLMSVVARVGPRLDTIASPESHAAMAAVLASTHKALHRMFKPDETAEGRAVAVARGRDPAANQNAASVVIHPLHPPDQTPPPRPLARQEPVAAASEIRAQELP